MAHTEIGALEADAAAVVARAAAGESITITDCGRPVALLSPIPTSRVQTLIASGQASRARRDISDLPVPMPGPELSEALATMRG